MLHGVQVRQIQRKVGRFPPRFGFQLCNGSLGFRFVSGCYIDAFRIMQEKLLRHALVHQVPVQVGTHLYSFLSNSYVSRSRTLRIIVKIVDKLRYLPVFPPVTIATLPFRSGMFSVVHTGFGG
jgi:hypothetical protein